MDTFCIQPKWQIQSSQEFAEIDIGAAFMQCITVQRIILAAVDVGL